MVVYGEIHWTTWSNQSFTLWIVLAHKKAPAYQVLNGDNDSMHVDVNVVICVILALIFCPRELHWLYHVWTKKLISWGKKKIKRQCSTFTHFNRREKLGDLFHELNCVRSQPSHELANFLSLLKASTFKCSMCLPYVLLPSHWCVISCQYLMSK